MKAKPENTPTIKQLAEGCGLSEKTLHRYKAEGCDIYDSAALQAHMETKRTKPTAQESAEMQAARLRLINVQIERHEHFLSVARGKHVAREEVIRDIIAHGAKLRSVVLGLNGEVANWAGLDPVAMHLKARDFTDGVLAESYAWCKWVGMNIKKLPVPESAIMAIAQAQVLAAMSPPADFDPEATKDELLS